MRSSLVAFVLFSVGVSGCAELEGRVCTDGNDCIEGYFCSSSKICILDGSEVDAGEVDAGAVDAGEVDAGEVDAGEADAGEADAGEVDAGEVDAGEVDAGPGGCPAGQWDHDSEPLTACIPFTTCGPGSFVSTTGTRASDQACSDCTDGTFSSADNATSCLPWVQCAAGTIQSAAGNVAASPSCVDCAAGSYCPGGTLPLQPCALGQWDDDASAATACLALTASCAPGTFFNGFIGSATEDRGCPVCAVGFTTISDASACSAFSSCNAGSFISTPGSPSNDVGCSPCVVGTFSAVENATTCAPWTACPIDYSGFDGSDIEDQVCDYTLLFGTDVSDRLESVAVGEDDSIYVVGRTDGLFIGAETFGETDMFARKYSSTKENLWHYFRGNALDNQDSHIAVNGSRVFIGGQDRNDNAPRDEAFYRVIDSNGDFGSLDTGATVGSADDDRVTAVVVDAAGNVYLVGTSDGNLGAPNPGGEEQGFILKYDASMTTQIWERGAFHADDLEFRDAVAVQDGVVVVGFRSGTVTSNLYIAKFNFDGDLVWSEEYGTSTSREFGTTIALDSDGSFVVGGLTTGNWPGEVNAGFNDFFVARISANGQELVEVAQFGSTETDSLSSITLKDGKIYAAGVTAGDLGAPSIGNSDAFVLQLASIGGKPRILQFGTPNNDAVADLVATSTEIVVVGYSAGDLDGQLNAGSFDGFIKWIAFPPD